MPCQKASRKEAFWHYYLWIPVKRHPADRECYGRSAGLRRNHEMAQCAEALIAVLYPGSRGTENMIKQAREAGLKIYIKRFDPPTDSQPPTPQAENEDKEQNQ